LNFVSVTAAKLTWICDRYNQINDSVTHVVIDSLTEDIVTLLQAASVTAR